MHYGLSANLELYTNICKFEECTPSSSIATRYYNSTRCLVDDVTHYQHHFDCLCHNIATINVGPTLSSITRSCRFSFRYNIMEIVQLQSAILLLLWVPTFQYIGTKQNGFNSQSVALDLTLSPGLFIYLFIYFEEEEEKGSGTHCYTYAKFTEKYLV